MDGFVSVIAGTVSPLDFFDPANMGAIMETPSPWDDEAEGVLGGRPPGSGRSSFSWATFPPKKGAGDRPRKGCRWD